MLQRLIPFLLSFLLTLSASAQIGAGVDFLASNHSTFPQNAFDVFRGTHVRIVGTLWGTFGTNTSGLDQFIASCPNRLTEACDPSCLVRIHLMNGVCRRWNRCDVGEVAPSLSVSEFNHAIARHDPKTLKALRKRIADVAQYVAANNERAIFLVSTGLEDNYSPKAYAIILNELKAALPPETYVGRNPMVKATNFGADFLELHGVLNSETFAGVPSSTLRIYSADGRDVSPSSLLAEASAVKNFDYLLFWRGPWQGITSSQFIKPRRRTFVVSNSDLSLINSLIRSVEHVD